MDTSDSLYALCADIFLMNFGLGIGYKRLAFKKKSETYPAEKHIFTKKQIYRALLEAGSQVA